VFHISLHNLFGFPSSTQIAHYSKHYHRDYTTLPADFNRTAM
jgi:hypothetical protein